MMERPKERGRGMVSVVGHHLWTSLVAFKLSVLRQLEYPLFLISWLLLIPFQYFAGFWMLKVLGDRFGNIAGWTLQELAFLYGLGLLSHAMVITFFIETLRLDNLLLTGGLDRILLRPLHPLFHFCFRQVNLIGLIDFLPASVIFFWACNELNVSWSVPFVLSLGICIIGATMIRAGIYLTLASFAFWTTRSEPLVMGGMTLMDRTTNYPLQIYPYYLQWIFTFLVPLGFINFYPSNGLLKRPVSFLENWSIPVLTPLVGTMCFTFAVVLFKRGLRRYEGAGS